MFNIIKMYGRSMIIVTHNDSIIKGADLRYRLEFGSLNPLLDDIN